MNVTLVLPVVVPLLTAVALVLARRRTTLQDWGSVVGASALLMASGWLLYTVCRGGIIVSHMGGWPAPYGISFVADLFSALMVTVAALMGFAVAVYSLVQVDAARRHFGYAPLLHVLLMGVCGAFLTGDLFNLYVWFEVMLIASFALMALGGERGQLEGSVKYVTINLVSSALFLSGVGIVYGATGTLNMADLCVRLAAFTDARVPTILSILFLIAFGIKSAVFPLFFWLPASYHTPPAAVSAVFAGLLTKVGVYALIRVFTLLFVHDPGFTHWLLLIIAGLTMTIGVLGAVAQKEFRQILSFHIVSQIGYMIMGLALYSPLALAGSVFYILHHIVVKTSLFLVSGIVERLTGSGELKNSGGIYRRHGGLALLFLIPAMSLAGVPPLSGFFAKLSLVQAGLEGEEYLIVFVALGVGLLTMFSMMKIWMEVFWKGTPGKDKLEGSHDDDWSGHLSDAPKGSAGWKVMLYGPPALLAAITVVIGVFAGPMFALATMAAEQLLDPDQYVNAALKGES